MPEWRVEIRLKFPGIPFRRKVGFRYEWKAWLLAFEVLGVESFDDFDALDPDTQVTAIHYGAAIWDAMTHFRRVRFTREDMVAALSRASKADNILLAETMAKAKFPEWMRHLVEEDGEGKKKP